MIGSIGNTIGDPSPDAPSSARRRRKAFGFLAFGHGVFILIKLFGIVAILVVFRGLQTRFGLGVATLVLLHLAAAAAVALLLAYRLRVRVRRRR